MPLYPYRCTQCGHRFEKIQSFHAEQEKVCPKCGGAVERILTAPGLQFKGAGWYVNDYSKSGGSSSSESSSGGSGSDSMASEKKADAKSDSKSDSKSETKSDSKASSSSDSGSSGSTSSATSTPAAGGPAKS